MRLWRGAGAIQLWAASSWPARASLQPAAAARNKRLLQLRRRGCGLRALSLVPAVLLIPRPPTGRRSSPPSFGRGLASSNGPEGEPGHPPAKATHGPRADFEAVFLPLLQAFHAREGHPDVPAAYKVTVADAAAAGVPVEVWVGYSLGRAAGLIWAQGAFVSSTAKGAEKKAALFGRRRAKLATINFDTDGARRFGWVVLAQEWYGREHQGDMDVLRYYVMGAAECRAAGLPAHVSEFRLGQTVATIRSHKHFVSGRPGNRARLDEVGFVWESAQHTFDTVVVPALEWYGREHDGGMEVPARYLMGAAECRAAGLPAHVCELRLGPTVGNIRALEQFVSGRPGNRARLEEIGMRL